MWCTQEASVFVAVNKKGQAGGAQHQRRSPSRGHFARVRFQFSRMRQFEDACLTPVQVLSPKQIKALRERQQVSQTVFSNYLNVTPNL
jgi:DNA-binding transcriptional regulator YiaG